MSGEADPAHRGTLPSTSYARWRARSVSPTVKKSCAPPPVRGPGWRGATLDTGRATTTGAWGCGRGGPARCTVFSRSAPRSTHTDSG